MVAVILNGGSSTRMAPYSDAVIPKGLLPVRKNKNGAMDPLLFVQLEQLEQAGIRNVIVVANERNENAFRFATTYFLKSSMNVTVISQDEPGQLNAVVTVVRALCRGLIQDDLLVIDGDTYIKYEYELSGFVRAFERQPNEILTAIGRVDRHDKYAMVTTDEDRVLHIEEKPAEWLDESMLAKIGILGIPRALLPMEYASLEQGTTDFIAAFLSTGVRYAEMHNFKDIGTWDDYVAVLERGIYA